MATAPAASAKPRPPTWVAVPRLAGRLTAADIGLVINIADPYSVAVGAHYIRRRGLTPQQVLRVSLPTAAALTREDFERLREAIQRRFDGRAQALALAWVAPYAVECNSITGALALGFDGELCQNSCAPSRPSRYFNSPSLRPWADVGWRPSMLLAAPSIEQARALIDRGVASDGVLARVGRPPVTAMLLLTDD
ncbi:MAG: TIGR03790 family protein, partial [Chitinophagaceae bacterium]|nr:TIGR03790 family protein [Rubrivivax sp.]